MGQFVDASQEGPNVSVRVGDPESVERVWARVISLTCPLVMIKCKILMSLSNSPSDRGMMRAFSVILEYLHESVYAE